MARFRFSALAVLAFSLCGARAASAQVPVPHDHSSEDLSVYRSESLQAALSTLEEWRKAWAAGNAQQVARTYTDAAELVMPSRQVIRGRPAIQTQMNSELLPRIGEIQVSMDDADVGGSLVYLFGRFFQQPRSGVAVDPAHPESSTVQTGTYVTILKQDGRRWLIRSQVFTLDKPTAETTTAAGATAPDGTNAGTAATQQ
jgi:ketosteroid isomerase-like protein